jgi:hypothetical protein
MWRSGKHHLSSSRFQPKGTGAETGARLRTDLDDQPLCQIRMDGPKSARQSHAGTPSLGAGIFTLCRCLKFAIYLNWTDVMERLLRPGPRLLHRRYDAGEQAV